MMDSAALTHSSQQGAGAPIPEHTASRRAEAASLREYTRKARPLFKCSLAGARSAALNSAHSAGQPGSCANTDTEAVGLYSLRCMHLTKGTLLLSAWTPPA